jgi:hypothetical protein
MKANEFLVEGKKDRRDVKRTVKPRNPVAHAAQTVAKGSGAHKDKKRAAKQGETKHKNAAVVGETKRMSAAVKLQRAWDRERAKSSASYERERMRRELQGISDRMKPKEEPKKVSEKYNAEYDDEAGMADNNLETLKRTVDGLDNLIHAGDNLPEWCQEKIAVAKSMLVAVWDYMESAEKEVEESKYPFAGAKVGQKAGPAGQLKGKDPKGYPKGKLVGGGM